MYGFELLPLFLLLLLLLLPLHLFPWCYCPMPLRVRTPLKIIEKEINSIKRIRYSTHSTNASSPFFTFAFISLVLICQTLFFYVWVIWFSPANKNMVMHMHSYKPISESIEWITHDWFDSIHQSHRFNHKHFDFLIGLLSLRFYILRKEMNWIRSILIWKLIHSFKRLLLAEAHGIAFANWLIQSFVEFNLSSFNAQS